ncbi:unnamed protein product [Adineta steineri]|uniref:Uncharacterized protein n=1 Tax=Adineta steineri TaxID=433720 RepID=A0A815REF0_9BILA|nr:unnamed protein product [Adineta steineri]CAF3772668.1 unnamed protein product [Adineta steineri]
MGFSLVLIIILMIELSIALRNVIMNWSHKKISHRPPTFNLYLFHHLIICIIRCIIIFLVCFSIILFQKCLSIEIFIHFLLLLSTFDLLLIIVSETAHFWDSTINHKSTLYSKCCLVFGIIINYFVSSLFLSIHITMNGENPLIIDICQKTTKTVIKYLHIQTSHEKSLIPTIITYVLFILIDLLTMAWIFISYRDISNLKRKRLATVFFSSLIFTNFKEHERLTMVNHSLKRLLTLILFLISNIIIILPIITIKIFHISLTVHQRIIFIYFTTLPWIDCITFLFYEEIKFPRIKLFSKKQNSDEDAQRRQRIGRRLSSYQEFIISTSSNVQTK